MVRAGDHFPGEESIFLSDSRFSFSCRESRHRLPFRPSNSTSSSSRIFFSLFSHVSHGHGYVCAMWRTWERMECLMARLAAPKNALSLLPLVPVSLCLRVAGCLRVSIFGSTSFSACLVSLKRRLDLRRCLLYLRIVEVDVDLQERRESGHACRVTHMTRDGRESWVRRERQERTDKQPEYAMSLTTFAARQA